MVKSLLLVFLLFILSSCAEKPNEIVKLEILPSSIVDRRIHGEGNSRTFETTFILSDWTEVIFDDELTFNSLRETNSPLMFRIYYENGNIEYSLTRPDVPDNIEITEFRW